MRIKFFRENLLRSFDLELEETDTTVTVKEMIWTKRAYLPYQYCLEYEGEELKDEKRLIDYGIEEGSVVSIKWKQKEIEDKMDDEYREITKRRQLLFDQLKASINQDKVFFNQLKASIDQQKASINQENASINEKASHNLSITDPFNAIHSVSDNASLEIARASTGVTLDSFTANDFCHKDSFIDDLVDNYDHDKRSFVPSDSKLNEEYLNSESDESSDDKYSRPLETPENRSIRCYCKGGCDTKRCTCFKNNMKCNIYCHRNNDCKNGRRS